MKLHNIVSIYLEKRLVSNTDSLHHPQLVALNENHVPSNEKEVSDARINSRIAFDLETRSGHTQGPRPVRR